MPATITRVVVSPGSLRRLGTIGPCEQCCWGHAREWWRNGWNRAARRSRPVRRGVGRRVPRGTCGTRPARRPRPAARRAARTGGPSCRVALPRPGQHRHRRRLPCPGPLRRRPRPHAPGVPAVGGDRHRDRVAGRRNLGEVRLLLPARRRRSLVVDPDDRSVRWFRRGGAAGSSTPRAASCCRRSPTSPACCTGRTEPRPHESGPPNARSGILNTSCRSRSSATKRATSAGSKGMRPCALKRPIEAGGTIQLPSSTTPAPRKRCSLARPIVGAAQARRSRRRGSRHRSLRRSPGCGGARRPSSGATRRVRARRRARTGAGSDSRCTPCRGRCGRRGGSADRASPREDGRARRACSAPSTPRPASRGRPRIHRSTTWPVGRATPVDAVAVRSPPRPVRAGAGGC